MGTDYCPRCGNRRTGSLRFCGSCGYDLDQDVPGSGASGNLMSPITVYESEQVTVWYHPDRKVIHHQMHKYTHGQAYRDALMAGLEAMKEYHAQKWLSDDRLNPVLKPEDQQWSGGVWRPAVIAAGWKYWAIVQPENVIAKLRMDKLAEVYSKLGVTVQFFGDPEEAMKWLESP
jgi:hypothetical protein